MLGARRRQKYRALLLTCYAAGPRIVAKCWLRVNDIDSERMVIHVRSGKSGEDRDKMLSPRLLELLREYWKTERPADWLFPGKRRNRSVTIESARHAFRSARDAVGLPLEMLCSTPVGVIDWFTCPHRISVLCRAECSTPVGVIDSRTYVHYRCARYTKPGHSRIRVPEADLDRQVLTLFDRMRIDVEINGRPMP